MIRTERLVLRGPRPGDLDAMCAIYSDPLNMAYWSSPPHPDRATTETMLAEKIAAFDAAPVNFFIEVDGVLVGNAGLYCEWEVGFMLHHPYHRRGYVSEAMRAILPHIWATTKAPYLTADVDPRNAASIGLLQGLGFTETHRASATYCIDGVWVDSIYFSLIRPSD